MPSTRHGEDLAADRTSCTWAVARRLQPLAGIPQRVLPRRPVGLVAPWASVRFARKTFMPPQTRRGPRPGSPRCRCGIRQAGIQDRSRKPFPAIGVVRIAGAPGERADMYVAIIDVPALVAGFRISSSGELGHPPLMPRPHPPGKSSTCWGSAAPKSTGHRMSDSRCRVDGRPLMAAPEAAFSLSAYPR